MTVINLYEELLETSTMATIQTSFLIFSQYIQEFKLEVSIQDSNTYYHYCTRMCRKIMQKLSLSRDVTFKS